MKFIATFGSAHKLNNGDSAQNCYIAIEAEKEEEARELMYHLYDNKYAFMYATEEAAGVERFGLIEVELGE